VRERESKLVFYYHMYIITQGKREQRERESKREQERDERER